MRQCSVAIAGFGAIGRAVAAMLLSRRDRYRAVYETEVRLVAVCGSRSGVSDERGLEMQQLGMLEAGKSGPDFILSSGANVLIEAGPSDFRTGGPGLAYIRAALARGHDAIVISKGALVYDGRQLRETAQASGLMLKISGAAGAALPGIDLLDYALSGCAISRIEGILNATTNFLLDAMMARGVGFDTALKEAQAAGLTEGDPRNDTEGWDTACKLLLLANFGVGTNLDMADLSVTGIQSVDEGMIAGWQRAGEVPKLVGEFWYEAGEARAVVGVRSYPLLDPLARISGANKGIRITTDAMGEIVAIGGGLEPTATAAAALKDLEHILSARTHRPS